MGELTYAPGLPPVIPQVTPDYSAVRTGQIGMVGGAASFRLPLSANSVVMINPIVFNPGGGSTSQFEVGITPGGVGVGQIDIVAKDAAGGVNHSDVSTLQFAVIG